MATRASRQKPAQQSAGSRRPRRRASSRGVEVVQNKQSGFLGGLVLAIVLGALGFVASFFWLAAIVVLSVLVGLAVAERRRRTGEERGAVTEVVTAVVEDIQGLSRSAAELEKDV